MCAVSYILQACEINKKLTPSPVITVLSLQSIRRGESSVRFLSINSIWVTFTLILQYKFYTFTAAFCKSSCAINSTTSFYIYFQPTIVASYPTRIKCIISCAANDFTAERPIPPRAKTRSVKSFMSLQSTESTLHHSPIEQMYQNHHQCYRKFCRMPLFDSTCCRREADRKLNPGNPVVQYHRLFWNILTL